LLLNLQNGVKTINGRNWQEILNHIHDAEVDVELLQHIFNNANSDQELIREFKKLNATYSPVSILFYLKLLTQGSIADVNDYFQKIIEP